MSGWWLYTMKVMKETYRSPMKAFLIFFLPVIFVFSLSFIYGDFSANQLVMEDTLRLGVINQDILDLETDDISQLQPVINEYLTQAGLVGNPLTSSFGRHLVDNLQTNSVWIAGQTNRSLEVVIYSSVPDLDDAVRGRYLSIGMIIPANFSEVLLSGIITRHFVETGEILTVDNMKNTTGIEIFGDYSSIQFFQTQGEFSSLLDSYVGGFTSLQYGNEIVSIDTRSILTQEITEFDSYIPGFYVYVLILGISGTAGVVVNEKQKQSIERVYLTGYPAWKVIVGVLIYQLLVTIVQVLAYFISVYFSGFSGTILLGPLIVISLLAILPILGIGFLMATFMDDARMALTLPGVAGIPLSFLTGSFIPLPVTYIGQSNVQIWHLNPFFSMSELVRKYLFHSPTWGDIQVDVISLIVSSIILLGSGIILLRKRLYKG